MMLRRRLIATGLMFTALSGCGGGDDAQVPQLLDFSLIDATASSMIKTARFTTVRTDADWQALWTEHKGSSSGRPAVDFQTKMVIGVFLGERPNGCYSAEIRRVVQDAGTIRVEYRDLPPQVAGQTCTTGFTYPAVLATITRSDLPTNFVKVTD